MATDPMVGAFGKAFQFAQSGNPIGSLNEFLNGQGTPPGLLMAADAAMSGNLPFSPSPTSSSYQNFINSGMPWEQASDAATAETMMTMDAKNEAVQKTIQTDQKGRAQQAARNMLEIFPEFTFNAQPLPPYSDALTEFARSFGVSPKAILDEMNQTKNEVMQVDDDEVQSGTQKQNLKFNVDPTRELFKEEGVEDEGEGDEGEGDEGVVYSGMSPTELLRRYRDSISKGYEGPSISSQKSYDATVAFMREAGQPLTLTDKSQWRFIFGLDKDFQTDGDRRLLPTADSFTDPAAEPKDPIEEVDPAFKERMRADAEAAAAAADIRPYSQKEIDPYDVFSGYEDPAGAIFESVLRQKLGRRANNPRILNASMRGTGHSLGNFFLRQLDVGKNYGELSYHGYLSEDDPSLYRSTPDMSRQSYERIVRAARAAYNEADYNSLTWVRGDELPAWYSGGMAEGDEPPPGEAISYNRLLTIGELVRNPTYEKSVAMAQAGITGKGIMGQLQMKGVDGLYTRWQNEQIADPSQERRTFLAFLSTLKNTPWYVDSPEGTDTKSDFSTGFNNTGI